MRIRKAKEDGGGTSFADYVWKPVVLIEMKKRGVDLSRHCRQAFDYWTRLVPGRPRHVVLCNFDPFDVYDFDRQFDAPVDPVALGELPGRWGPLAFLFPTNEKSAFGNDREAVTRDAAFRLATRVNKLTVRNVARPLAAPPAEKTGRGINDEGRTTRKYELDVRSRPDDQLINFR